MYVYIYIYIKIYKLYKPYTSLHLLFIVIIMITGVLFFHLQQGKHTIHKPYCIIFIYDILWCIAAGDIPCNWDVSDGVVGDLWVDFRGKGDC